MKRMLTFDDVWLQPFYNNVDSRTEPTLTTKLTKNCTIGTPIIASSMESVIGPELADVLLSRKSMPIFHRFTSEDVIRDWVNRYGGNSFISWGVNNLNKLWKLLESCNQSPAGICFDVAHGHSEKMKEAVVETKYRYPKLDVIAGAVCTKIAVHDLISWGADAIRVGIGPGSACTTRGVTGFGLPQFSAIQDCATIGNRFKVPIIADGGIRSSADIVKALAAGASTVMIGKMFSATEESAAQKRGGPPSKESYGGMREAYYRGQASEAFQRDGRVPEGTDGWIPVSGSAKDLFDTLEAGIRSGLTYGGARSIEELQKHATFVEVTPSFQTEAGTRL